MKSENLGLKLLRRPRPFADESISGFFIRIAEANGYLRINISSVFGFKWNNQRTYIYGKATYSQLSELVDVPEAVLKNLAYKPISGISKQHIGKYEFFGQPVFSYTLQYQSPGLCSECLAENAYQRKIWDLFPVTACPAHKRMLFNTCPECRRKISYNRNRLCFCDCGFDFRSAKTEAVPDEELIIVRRIYELCGMALPEQQSEFGKNVLPNALFNLNLSGLLSALFLVIRETRKADILGKNLAKMEIFEIHKMLNEVLNIYENFPINFFEFLDSLKNINGYAKNQPGIVLISKQRSTIYCSVIRIITKILEDSQFDFLRNALREFLNRQKLESYKIFLDYTQTTAEEFYAAHVTMRDVIERLKTTEEVIRAMFKTGALRYREGVMPKGSLISYIKLTDVEQVERRLPDIISTAEAAALLNIYQYQINHLIKEGVVEIVEDIKIAPVYSRVVSKQRIIELYNSFQKAAVENPAYKSDGKKLSTPSTVRILSKLHINYGQMARMVLSGELAPAGRDGSVGLNGFVYHQEQVNGIFKQKTEQLGNGTLSLAEAHRMLQIQSSVFRALTRKNYLTVIDTKTVIRKRIPLESFARFRSEYVFSNEVAREFSTSPEYVNRQLEAKNILPVEKEIALHNYLYRRAEVQNIIIEKPVYKAWLYQKREYGLHTLEETALKLKLSEQEVLLAVERKLIRTRRRGDRSRIRFSTANLAGFRELNLPHVNFLRRQDTARMFGITAKAFEIKYLETNRIFPEVRKYRKHKISLFYSINELNELKALEETCIGSTETAAILGISIASVNRLIGKGELKTVSGRTTDGYCNYRLLKSDIEEYCLTYVRNPKPGRRRKEESVIICNNL